MNTTTKSKETGEPVVLPVSLRDYFAAAALRGILAAQNRYNPGLVATEAYEFADAMLAERAK